MHADEAWMIPGAGGEPIYGSAHPPSSGAPAACALIAHGFKGYKDYGFIPLLAQRLAGRLPVVAHRFNFSHSGIGEGAERFEREDLFELDTWSKQVHDLRAATRAALAGELPGTPAGLPLVWIGHSRGGASCLLAAGRGARDGDGLLPSAIVTMAAPADANRLPAETQRELLEVGHLVSPSARTGQDLRIGKPWLQEQLESPGDHDIPALCARVRCPALVVHGADDPTVPAADARLLGAALPDALVRVIDGADHVFNTPNPADPDAPPSAQLSELLGAVTAFVAEMLPG